MRKIIVSMMVSADGFTETKDKNIEWHVWGKDMERFMDNFMSGIDTILLGRKSFEMMEAYWPSDAVRKSDPVIAKRMNETQKLVFSSTRDSTDWENTTFAKDINSTITQLKQQPGNDIVLFAGATLANAFIDKGLIDEYQVIINPIALGQGNLLFQNELKLQLVKAESMPCGNVIVTYKNKTE